MTLEEAKRIVDAVEDYFDINPKASSKELASYGSRLLAVKQSASYTEAKRMVIESEKKGA